MWSVLFSFLLAKAQHSVIEQRCEEWSMDLTVARGHHSLFREEGQKGKRIDDHHQAVYEPMK